VAKLQILPPPCSKQRVGPVASPWRLRLDMHIFQRYLYMVTYSYFVFCSRSDAHFTVLHFAIMGYTGDFGR